MSQNCPKRRGAGRIRSPFPYADKSKRPAQHIEPEQQQKDQKRASENGFARAAAQFVAQRRPDENRQRGQCRSRDGRSIIIDGAAGDERAQLLYVEDAARATLAALDHPKPPASVYNLARPTENYISLRQYHAEVRALVPTGGDVRFTGKARDMGPVDIGRIAADIGFRPAYSVRDGLRKILHSGLA